MTLTLGLVALVIVGLGLGLGIPAIVALSGGGNHGCNGCHYGGCSGSSSHQVRYRHRHVTYQYDPDRPCWALMRLWRRTGRHGRMLRRHGRDIGRLRSDLATHTHPEFTALTTRLAAVEQQLAAHTEEQTVHSARCPHTEAHFNWISGVIGGVVGVAIGLLLLHVMDAHAFATIQGEVIHLDMAIDKDTVLGVLWCALCALVVGGVTGQVLFPRRVECEGRDVAQP